MNRKNAGSQLIFWGIVIASGIVAYRYFAKPKVPVVVEEEIEFTEAGAVITPTSVQGAFVEPTPTISGLGCCWY